MKNPNGSDIPFARNLISGVIVNLRNGNMTPEVAANWLEIAHAKLTRQKALRQAKKQQTMPITEQMKADIRYLASDDRLSNADIAELVGLPKCASGRVTEVLQGLR